MAADNIIFFAPSDLEIGIAPDQYQRPCVTVRLLGVEEKTGMTPGIGLALALFPSEARQLAEVLVRKAAEAEALAPLS